MDWEQKYKDLLRLAKEAMSSGSYDKETITYILPELEEPKEVKLINEIIEIVDGYSGEYQEDNRDLIDWLERQKEPRLLWSEDDEMGWEEAMACIAKTKLKSQDKGEFQNAVTGELWLKKIHCKTSACYWRPSSDQIQALEYLIRSYGESGTIDATSPILQNLRLLLKDLNATF